MCVGDAAPDSALVRDTLSRFHLVRFAPVRLCCRRRDVITYTPHLDTAHALYAVRL